MLAVGYANSGAEIYIPSMDKWVKTTVPTASTPATWRGISQMFDGRVYVYGLAGKAYIWTPGAAVTDPGSWVTTALITTTAPRRRRTSTPTRCQTAWCGARS